MATSNDSTGRFKEGVIYTIKLGNGTEIRYQTAYELGYIVGSNDLPLENPYDPINVEMDEFNEGLWAGQETRKQPSGNKLGVTS